MAEIQSLLARHPYTVFPLLTQLNRRVFPKVVITLTIDNLGMT